MTAVPKFTSQEEAMLDRLAARDEYYRKDLDSIGRCIGYGNACHILGELWDDMLERQWGMPRGRGRMERRPDMELMEALRQIELIGHPDSDQHSPMVKGTHTSDEIVDRVVAFARAALARVEAR